MHIKLNNEIIEFPDGNTTISDLLSSRNIKQEGTAVARNGKLVERAKWELAVLENNDDIVIISAAFGG